MLINGLNAETGNSSTFLLTDENVFDKVLKPHKEVFFPFPVCILKAGERSKNIHNLEKILEWLLAQNADRNATLICLGGGMVTDIGGFAASVYKRGIKVIFIPTTLLAMCDASIGGKNGINLSGAKNQAGTFFLPVKIFIYTDFLRTLPEKELKSGYAEMLKHFIIKDADSFNQSELPLQNTHEIFERIKSAVRIKQEITLADPKEMSLRKILNFGHTIGHALESLALNDLDTDLPHGYAVAEGMLIESKLSTELCGLSEEAFQQIYKKIRAVFPPFHFSSAMIPKISEYMQTDKKNQANQVMGALIKNIGHALPEVPLTVASIQSSLKWYVNENR